MINTQFRLTDWKKESLVVISYKTPYDWFLKELIRERVYDLVFAIKFMGGWYFRPVSKVRLELQAVIYAQGMQDKIKVSRDPISFVYEVYGIGAKRDFWPIIHCFKQSIARMDPAEEYRRCPICNNVLIVTGGESFHHSTSTFFFCLKCGGIFEWYRDKKYKKLKRMYRLKWYWAIE